MIQKDEAGEGACVGGAQWEESTRREVIGPGKDCHCYYNGLAGPGVCVGWGEGGRCRSG